MSDIRRASLDEITRMRREGKLHHDPDAPAGEDLGADFWAKADVVVPKNRCLVSLLCTRSLGQPEVEFPSFIATTEISEKGRVNVIRKSPSFGGEK